MFRCFQTAVAVFASATIEVAFQAASMWTIASSTTFFKATLNAIEIIGSFVYFQISFAVWFFYSSTTISSFF